jgi:hypothetical protein
VLYALGAGGPRFKSGRPDHLQLITASGYTMNAILKVLAVLAGFFILFVTYMWVPANACGGMKKSPNPIGF